MKLNLPILDRVKDSQNILIAGAGGGSDIFCGLPIYFTLSEMGKNVHLGSFNSIDSDAIAIESNFETLLDGQLVGIHDEPVLPYSPESALAQWFQAARNEGVTIWTFNSSGAIPLREGYEKLASHLGIDTIILVDGGIDSLMRGDEESPGSLLEDSISLAAVDTIEVPVKILACVGFGTEQEICHYYALENMAALAKADGFFGQCGLTPEMEAFQLYESAVRFAREQPHQPVSHINAQIIMAVQGEFGNIYGKNRNFVSPLMGFYWFYDAQTVVQHSLLIPELTQTITLDDALSAYLKFKNESKLRRNRAIPY